MPLHRAHLSTVAIMVAGASLVSLCAPTAAASAKASGDDSSANTGTSMESSPTPTTPTTLVFPLDQSAVTVATTDELIAALDTAKPGHTIALQDGIYTSNQFEASADGTAEEPITLTGPRDAILTTGDAASGYGLHITGDHWKVLGLSTTDSGKGIVLDGSNHTLISGVDVGNTGTEGVHFRADSSDGIIENSVIHDTGTVTPAYGEGIYLGSAKSNWSKIMGSSSVMDQSDRIIVRNNEIHNTTTEGVDIKEGTTGGLITGNVFTNAGYSGANYGDSWVDVKGNAYTITGNSGSGTKKDAFQVHSQLDGWGRDNTFTDNIIHGDVPGVEVWVESPSLGTSVTTKSSGADSGPSNVLASS